MSNKCKRKETLHVKEAEKSDAVKTLARGQLRRSSEKREEVVKIAHVADPTRNVMCKGSKHERLPTAGDLEERQNRSEGRRVGCTLSTLVLRCTCWD